MPREGTLTQRGQLIEKAQKDTGLNDTELAAAVGVREITIFRWKVSHCVIHKNHLNKLERTLKLSKGALQ